LRSQGFWLAFARSVPVAPAASHAVVRDYLLFCGYSETLRAFEASLGAVGGYAIDQW
jgi:hypothetical protein